MANQEDKPEIGDSFLGDDNSVDPSDEDYTDRDGDATGRHDTYTPPFSNEK